MVNRDEPQIGRYPVLTTHVQYYCKCGRKLAGCTCSEHQSNKVIRSDSCDACRARPIKDILRIEEKG